MEKIGCSIENVHIINSIILHSLKKILSYVVTLPPTTKIQTGLVTLVGNSPRVLSDFN